MKAYSLKLILLPVCLLVFTVYSSSLTAGRILEPKSEPKQTRKCCPVGISYMSGPGKVMLEKICLKENQSVFQMRIFGLQSVCTNPQGTVLRDQSGHRYPMTGFKGIPHCKNNGFNRKSGNRFYWYFDRLHEGTTKINLVEEEDDVTRGLTFWAWRNVSLAHCKFH